MCAVFCTVFEDTVPRSYVYLLMGVLIGSAVVPIACCLSWSKCTATAAISGAWAGLAASVTCWLVYTKCTYGEITLATTGEVQMIIPSQHGSGIFWQASSCQAQQQGRCGILCIP